MDVFLTGFPKRLLVALSLFVILMMCAMPVESRAVEHKRRHQRRQPENVAQLARDPQTPRRPKNPSVEQYKNATRKIMKKLKNTRRFFNQERKVLNESREYRDGMPDWLPAVNFVDIHFHDYKMARKVGGSIWERKCECASFGAIIKRGDSTIADDGRFHGERSA
ncbi:unnamed protein product, partial [Iphiclides podalirius]